MTVVSADPEADNYSYLAELMEWDDEEVLHGNAMFHCHFDEDDFGEIDESDWYQVIAIGQNSNEPGIIAYNWGSGFVVVSGCPVGFVWRNYNDPPDWGSAAEELLTYMLEMTGPKWIFSVPEEGEIEGENSTSVDIVFQMTGGTGGGTGEVFVFNQDLELVDEFDQFVEESMNGIRDLAWDGKLLWGGDGNVMYGFTTEGVLRTSFEVEDPNPIMAVAWDPDREVLWACHNTSRIYGMDREGNMLEESIRRPGRLRIYGMSWYPEDPDGYYLYLFCRNEDIESELGVAKVDPETGEWMMVADLDIGEGDRPKGMFITNEIDVYSWVLAGVISRYGGEVLDRVGLWQVAARDEWMQIEPAQGVIEPGESGDFTLVLNSDGLPEAVFEGEIVFMHDGVGSETALGIELIITQGEVQTRRNVRLGLGWNMVSVNLRPDEENVATLTADLVEAGTLVMMKDGAGNFYYPAGELLTLELSGDRMSYELESGGMTYRTNGLTVIRLSDVIETPTEFGIVSAYPNPFNASTRIGYSLPEAGIIDLSVYDLTGRLVAELMQGSVEAGMHTTVFNGADLSSGVYFVRLEAAGQVSRQKLTLLK